MLDDRELVLELGGDAIRPAPPTSGAIDTSYITGIGSVAERMLILIDTGEKPNRAMYQMVWCYLIGRASLEELEAFIRTRR